MRSRSFIAIFIGTHLIFAFLLIYKHTRFVHTSFAVQKIERELQTLREHKQELTAQLYIAQSPEKIKEFAQQELAMKPIKLSQITKINGGISS